MSERLQQLQVQFPGIIALKKGSDSIRAFCLRNIKAREELTYSCSGNFNIMHDWELTLYAFRQKVHKGVGAIQNSFMTKLH